MGRQGIASGVLLSLAALIAASGCGRSVTHLDPADAATWDVLNRKADADSVVVLAAGHAHPARDAFFAPDSARWTDPVSGEARSEPSTDLSWALRASRGREAGGLAVVGALLVAGGLTLVGAAVGGMDWGWEDFVLSGAEVPAAPEPEEDDHPAGEAGP